MYECAICQELLGGSSVSKIPLYVCRKCYYQWICDEDGVPRMFRDHPKWLKFLLSQAALQRQTRITWKKRGVNIDAVSFSDLNRDDYPNEQTLIDILCVHYSLDKEGSVYS
jgi:hypothetical protein